VTGDTRPLIGLVVPPSVDRVPHDGPTLYGDRARFVARGLGLPEISTRGYDEVIDKVVDLATALRQAGAAAISLMGTSLSFYRGVRFNAVLEAEMTRRTGVPCTTMSHAVVRALQTLGVARVAVATAYIDEVNERLAAYLAASGFTMTAIRGLAIAEVAAVTQVTTERLVALCEEAWRAAPGADGILLSCGGLRTLEAVQRVEGELGVPVVASSPAGFWDVVRVAGLESRVQERGRLLEL
jgi:arylmalonate decarboxylase